MENTTLEMTEEKVTAVLENAVSQLGQLRKITSRSTHSSGNINLEFNTRTNMQVKHFEVASIIRKVFPSLPQSVTFPVIKEVHDNYLGLEEMLMTYTVSADKASYDILQFTEEKIVKKLSNLLGIEETNLSGASPLKIAISLNPYKCEALQISMESVQTSLKEQQEQRYPDMR
ncbi:efflux RND transporter permease subunit [Chitinophaga sp. 30R24]|uniref:efflux RND transporter permease subunit n=1 Tax=Chitinophaga sp. 30R24 TaxID=3248838 RepID=UPI003B9139B4